MDALAFIAVIGSFVIVALWYVANEAAGSAGEKGLLAFAPEDRVPRPETYAEKTRGGASPGVVTAKRRRRYWAKDEPAFRATGRRPRFGDRSKKD